jgi:2'-5' RNA ligase
LFFAFWPERALQIALAEATFDVVTASAGRPIPSDNFHVTLAFLGSVPEARLSDVMAVGTAVATEIAPGPIQVSFTTLEYWKKPRVLCVTGPEDFAAHSSGGAALADLLKSKLSATGFAPDLKPFRGHVTLARKVAHPTRTDAPLPLVWSFTEFVLVESRTEAHGSVYRVVQSYPFGTP